MYYHLLIMLVNMKYNCSLLVRVSRFIK